MIRCFSRLPGGRFVFGALACVSTLAGGAQAGAPFLEAGTYAGSSGGQTVARAIDIGQDGSIFVVGYTFAADLPSAVNAMSGFSDIYVMKLSADMTTLHWSAYVGGVGQTHHIEFATDCAATPDGGVIVTGKTETPDFPTVNALDSTLGGPSDAVLFKLDANGAMVFSTYIGGSAGENAEGAGYGKFLGEVEVAGTGEIFLAGNTRSADFPLVDPIDGTHGGFQDDVFVMRLSADGQSILASTFLGDEFRDEVWGMRLDPDGRPVIIGQAGPGWPQTAGAFSFGTPSSSGVVYATKLAVDAKSIAWSSRLSRINDSGGHLWFHELDIAPDGTIVVAGEATGGGWGIPGTAYQPDISEGSTTRDAVALCFAPDGSQLNGGTFLGLANAGEFSHAVGIDSFGQALFTVNNSVSGFTRLYKFDTLMTTLLEEPILLAWPGSTHTVRVTDDNNVVAMMTASSGETTPGAFMEENPGNGTYLARWNMMDSPGGTQGADLDGDGAVGSSDLAILLGSWGACAPGGTCAADLDGDGVVNSADLAALLGSWGA